MPAIRIHTASIVLILLVLPALWRASAQGPAAGYEPRIGFYAFFVEHDARLARIEKQRSVDADVAKGLERHIRSAIKLNPEDCSFVGVVARRTVRDLRVAIEEGAKYVEAFGPSGRGPDVEYLKSREKHRRALLETAMGDLRAGLSPAGWEALGQYIESEIRPRLRWKELDDAK